MRNQLYQDPAVVFASQGRMNPPIFIAQSEQTSAGGRLMAGI
jgi:hypothetical protein